ncbi:hypothetical protein D3C71_1460710 [compost metagenome]
MVLAVGCVIKTVRYGAGLVFTVVLTMLILQGIRGIHRTLKSYISVLAHLELRYCR